MARTSTTKKAPARSKKPVAKSRKPVRAAKEETPKRKKAAAPAAKPSRKKVASAPAKKSKVKEGITVNITVPVTRILHNADIDLSGETATIISGGVTHVVPVNDLLLVHGETAIIRTSVSMAISAESVESKGNRIILDDGDGVVRLEHGVLVNATSGAAAEEETEADGDDEADEDDETFDDDES